jgi:hypothetical protein
MPAMNLFARILTALVCMAGIASAGNIRLTIVGGKLDAAKAAKGPARSVAYISDLECLSLPGLRDIKGLCGQHASPPGSVPVDALVRVEIGESVVRTYPVPGTLTPKWDYSVILDGDFLDKGDNAAFALLDYESSGNERKLGDAIVKIKDLIKPGTRTVKVGKSEVTYKVEALSDKAAARTYKFTVPADKQIADLARDAKISATSSSGSYVLVPLAEGEDVEITATGKVQPSAKKHPERVATPDGIPTISAKIQFNQPGFRGCPGCNHAALIGQIGSTGMVIGAHKKITVENAGLLVLAINDLKVEDNAGAFEVTVVVSEPATTPAVQAPSKKKGGADDKAQAGIDPRVVEQVVDSHSSELDACVANVADPTGEVTLQFTISADGSLLGAAVEKASPNLKNAGDCMRKKMMAWKFPPPRGVVTARYPLSFSTAPM